MRWVSRPSSMPCAVASRARCCWRKQCCWRQSAILVEAVLWHIVSESTIHNRTRAPARTCNESPALAWLPLFTHDVASGASRSLWCDWAYEGYAAKVAGRRRHCRHGRRGSTCQGRRVTAAVTAATRAAGRQQPVHTSTTAGSTSLKISNQKSHTQRLSVEQLVKT
jgi:hypothetical protein